MLDKIANYNLKYEKKQYRLPCLVKKHYNVTMKNRFFIILTVLLAALILIGCKNSKTSPFAGKENLDKDTSYALGMSLGVNIKDSFKADELFPYINEFISGFKDGIADGKTRFSVPEAMELIEASIYALTEEKYAELMQKENSFLAENSKKPGVRITLSGLQYEVITETSGPKPSFLDEVLIHFEGTLVDGTVFDSTYHEDPTDLALYAIFPGWSEGLQLMSIGSKYKLYIPSELGCGPSGYGPIPPYATLIITVELLDILGNE